MALHNLPPVRRRNDDEPKHTMAYYAITIKHNTNGLDENQYKLLIDDYLDGFPHMIVESRWEKDSHDKLHYHAVFLAKKGLRYKPLMTKGYHVYVRRISNLKGWQDYIHKESNANYVARKAQKDFERLASTHYLFR